MVPIIEDVTDLPISEYQNAIDIHIDKNKVLAHFGYAEMTMEEFLYHEVRP